MFDIQQMVDTMNETASQERSNYHLTYGDLVKALKAAPADATFDERITGIGSYRGYYIDIALFTDEEGLEYEDCEFTGEYSTGEYGQWSQEHRHFIKEIPTNANELGNLLESIIGKDFVGYKGGNFTITEDKPLWFESQSNCSSSIAVIGIDSELKLQTKYLSEDDE